MRLKGVNYNWGWNINAGMSQCFCCRTTSVYTSIQREGERFVLTGKGEYLSSISYLSLAFLPADFMRGEGGWMVPRETL